MPALDTPLADHGPRISRPNLLPTRPAVTARAFALTEPPAAPPARTIATSAVDSPLPPPYRRGSLSPTPVDKLCFPFQLKFTSLCNLRKSSKPHAAACLTTTRIVGCRCSTESPEHPLCPPNGSTLPHVGVLKRRPGCGDQSDRAIGPLMYWEYWEVRVTVTAQHSGADSIGRRTIARAQLQGRCPWRSARTAITVNVFLGRRRACPGPPCRRRRPCGRWA